MLMLGGKTRHCVVGAEQRLGCQSPEVLVLDRVEEESPLAPLLHDAGQVKLRQVLGDGGGLGAYVVGQGVHRVLAVQQCPDDPQPGGVGQ